MCVKFHVLYYLIVVATSFNGSISLVNLYFLFSDHVRIYQNTNSTDRILQFCSDGYCPSVVRQCSESELIVQLLLIVVPIACLVLGFALSYYLRYLACYCNLYNNTCGIIVHQSLLHDEIVTSDGRVEDILRKFDVDNINVPG